MKKVCTADCKSICNQSSECEVRKYRINLLIRLTLIRAKHSTVGLSHPHISAFYGRVSALGRPNRPYQKVSPCRYTSEITYLQCSKIATDSYELATQLKLGKSLKKDHTTILICAFNVCFVLTCFYFSFNAEAPLNPSAMCSLCQGQLLKSEVKTSGSSEASLILVWTTK